MSVKETLSVTFNLLFDLDVKLLILSGITLNVSAHAVSFSTSYQLIYIDKHPDVVKVKVKQSRYRPEQAQSLERGTVLPFRDLGARSGCVVSIRPRPLYPREKPGTQGRSGRVRKISPPPGFDHRTVQHPYLVLEYNYNRYSFTQILYIHRR
jgi:hypothetical protein